MLGSGKKGDKVMNPVTVLTSYMQRKNYHSEKTVPSNDFITERTVTG